MAILRTTLTGILCLVFATTALTTAEGKTYGEGVQLQTATPIKDLLSQPERYVGKTVRVDGVVGAVCEEMGCWIELTERGAKSGLRFKVEDGVIVFPVSAKGKKASAEGTFVKADGATSHANADLGAKSGEKPAADPAKSAETPQAYLVRATGAVIY